jgi:hypothetical protein
MGLFKHGFSTADVTAYSIKYLTACNYAFRMLQKEGVVDSFKLLSLSFPLQITGVKKTVVSGPKL